MISNINCLNRDIVKFVISIFKQNNISFNELSLQKVIFEVKMDLGSTHQLYNKIPYYWYYY